MFEKSDVTTGRDKTLTVVVPWIRDCPTNMELYTSKGFRTLLARDTFHTGYIATVNAASTLVETEWMLLWNSDAIALFNATDIERELNSLPPEVAIAAPAKIVEGHETRVFTTETGRDLGPQDKVHTHVNIIDTGSLWVSMPVATEAIYPYFGILGTAYAPLFAVRTEWFKFMGGLSMFYHPGYYEDAHFWRLTRRMGRETVILPGLTYAHAGRESFEAVHGLAPLQGHLEENLRRYLLSWGALEPSAIVPVSESSETVLDVGAHGSF